MCIYISVLRFRTLLAPRVLVDVSQCSTETKIMGMPVSFPVGIAPTGNHKLAHPKGELMTASAASKENIIYTMSSSANTTIEDIKKIAPDSRKWFQLYILSDLEETKKVITRAIKCNFEAIVLTVDVPVVGLRRSVLREKPKYPDNVVLANFDPQSNSGSSSGVPFTDKIRSNVTWDIIAWLKSFVNVPIILKGILTPEDAMLAVKYKADAIWVSNHGGRQLDDAPSSLQALKRIAPIVKRSGLEIFIDGGIRTGADIFKCLAFGATAIFLGKPILCALAVEGEDGIRNALSILKRELSIIMALCGVERIDQINETYIWNEKSKI